MTESARNADHGRRKRRAAKSARSHSLLRGVAAGLAASAVVGVLDKQLGRAIPPEARRRERRVRAGSPHALAGPRFGAALLGRPLTPDEERVAKAAFGTAYAVGWGLVHAAARRRAPWLARFGGLPFAVLFYAVCDVAIAPLLGLTPTPRRLPWPIDAKELVNHVSWTATAEASTAGGSRVLAREVPGWLSGAMVIGVAVTCLWLEHRRPLRRRVEPALRHDVRNVAMSALTATAIRLTEKPLTDRLTRQVLVRRWGLVRRVALPAWVEVPLAVLLLDYTLYVWHVLTHRVPGLWRFHRVHHADLDLDASTALRFHAAEMVLSVPWRAAQVVAVGATPFSLSLWQLLTLMAILFHHSNVALPVRVERRLCRLLMTPRMHGIHHSIVRGETDSNWATIFAWPDYLHRTARLNVPQDAVTIGVPEYRAPDELTLPELLQMPFGPQRPAWRLPDGTRPERAATPAPRTRLLA